MPKINLFTAQTFTDDLQPTKPIINTVKIIPPDQHRPKKLISLNSKEDNKVFDLNKHIESLPINLSYEKNSADNTDLESIQAFAKNYVSSLMCWANVDMELNLTEKEETVKEDDYQFLGMGNIEQSIIVAEKIVEKAIESNEENVMETLVSLQDEIEKMFKTVDEKFIALKERIGESNEKKKLEKISIGFERRVAKFMRQ